MRRRPSEAQCPAARFAGGVEGLLRQLKITPVLRDERFASKPLPWVFQGKLRPEQLRADQAMLVHDTGVLIATG